MDPESQIKFHGDMGDDMLPPNTDDEDEEVQMMADGYFKPKTRASGYDGDDDPRVKSRASTKRGSPKRGSPKRVKKANVNIMHQS